MSLIVRFASAIGTLVLLFSLGVFGIAGMAAAAVILPIPALVILVGICVYDAIHDFRHPPPRRPRKPKI